MRKPLIAMILVLFFSGLAFADFVDNGNSTVTDTATGLMWQKETAPGTYTWQQALEYAENLTFPANGYTDWRLPNINELQTLVDYSRYTPAIYPVFRPHTSNLSSYWSSTTYASNTSYAWIVSFGYGSVYYDGKSKCYSVRAVRSGQ